MSAPALHLREEVSRGIVLSLFSQFSSVAQAILELTDNPIDYARGPLRIELTLDKAADLIVVEDSGGRGMGPEELRRWLAWGDGSHHLASDIGHYAQGGKAAAGYLADGVRLWAKRAGEPEVWLVEDEGWRTRSELKDFGLLEPADPALVPPSVAAEPLETGHVRIELRRCVPGRRWNLEQLRRQLASVYSGMLASGGLEIALNGKAVEPVAIPLDPAVPTVEIEYEAEGVSARGWAGRLDRARSEDGLRSGLRLHSKGRLIQDGVWFGFGWTGKGSYNHLIGELQVEGLTPNLNKSAYVEQDDEAWHRMGEEVLRQLHPLLARLRSSSDHRPITGKERQAAKEVRRELEEALRAEAGEGEVEAEGAKGRRPPTPKGGERDEKDPDPDAERGSGGGAPREPRTPRPEGAVGTLRRLGGRLRIPEVVVASWDAEVRSALVQESGRRELRINAAYPLYAMLGGGKGYVAETVLLEVLSADEEARAAGDLYPRLNSLMARWARSQTDEGTTSKKV